MITDRVVFLEEEDVVSPPVCAQFRIVVQGTQGERRAAAPTSHDLRRYQFLAFGSACVRLQVLTKSGNPLVQFAEDHITSITPQGIRPRYRRDSSHSSG